MRAIGGMRDLQLLSATLVYVVREATGAQHVSLLQRVPREAVLRAGASVGLTKDIEIAFAESGALAQELGVASGVLTLAELEESPAWWSLPRRQQEELRGADVRLLVPLRFNGHVAGLLALGPRADGRTYGQEECDLLTAIGDEPDVDWVGVRRIVGHVWFSALSRWVTGRAPDGSVAAELRHAARMLLD